jgi:unsaturated chondroitin disaccharide hydrolase
MSTGDFISAASDFMAIKIEKNITPQTLAPKIERMFELSAEKILSLENAWDLSRGTPVFTVKGKYTSRGWTEWTQGFQFGAALLQFDATGETQFLELGRRKTIELMASHVSHTGVHDHGFNNISTYGNLWRLMREGKIPAQEREKNFCELALKVSGAVQAARWTSIANGDGYIYSFNGPHSLFIDTMRSLRSLAMAHQLGHVLMGERDSRISLLGRLIQHARTTAAYAIYYGERRDAFDLSGRTAHESIFNTNDGNYRCPNSQQGYSPFTTWTRGLAWAICGYTEQLEFMATRPDEEFEPFGGRKAVNKMLTRAALATADFYIENSCTCGIPMWDTGAPNLHRLGEYLSAPANPFNEWEPVDSSAAAIAAQGLLRLGKHIRAKGKYDYGRAGLTVLNTLLEEPYLSRDKRHQGLLLHSIYHRPNGWDHIPKGQKVPNGESSMWGDYHLREASLMVLKETRREPYLTFF